MRGGHKFEEINGVSKSSDIIWAIKYHVWALKGGGWTYSLKDI